MKIIIAPDKFKGSLTSFEACQSISRGIKKINEKIVVSEFPMADGGDGFASVLKHYLKTVTIDCDTVDPLGRKISASYQWNEKNKTAVIEMAVASGLVLLEEKERNPQYTSSRGTGLLVKHAIAKGAKKIVLGLGGSATNDGGTGILSALGFQFAKEKDDYLQASGENLLLIKKIILPSFTPTVKFELACDVNNVLYGPDGAAYVYGPQKGADAKQVIMLDHGLKNLANVIKQQTGKEISNIPGAGAAGGIAAGLLPFFDVEMKNGIEMIIAASHIEDHLPNADLVVTGEGKIDSQSSAGKVVGHIAALAKKHRLDCVAFCGSMELDEAAVRGLGVKKIIPLVDETTDREDAIMNAATLLEEKASQLIKIL
jgi:glycerate 2-kinase